MPNKGEQPLTGCMMARVGFGMMILKKGKERKWVIQKESEINWQV